MAITPWGDLSISDAHVHFFSHGFYTALGKQRGGDTAESLGPLLGWQIPSADPSSLAARWVEELDRHHLRRACLIASIPGDEGSVADAVGAYPDRFYGFFMFDPTQPDALERIEKAGTNPNLHCMCLFPSMHRYSIADPRIAPVLEAAVARHLVIFVHCGSLSVGVRKKLGLRSVFDLRFSNPLDIHGVAQQFPQARFIVPHFGAGMFREALMLCDLCPNVWLDTSSSNKWMLYESLDLVTVFRRCLSVLGAGRLIFGSDSSFFPRGWQKPILDEQVSALSDAGVNVEQASQILGLNLEAVFANRVRHLAER